MYVTLHYNGSDFRALLDSGCDVSVLGRTVLPGLAYHEDSKELLAANSTPIPILGTAEVAFQMAGVALRHLFLVSDAIEEVILGSDWLEDQKCVWDFRKSVLWIGSVQPNVSVRLGSSHNREAVRRIYSSETVELPPMSQRDIPVKSIWNTAGEVGRLALGVKEIGERSTVGSHSTRDGWHASLRPGVER